MVERYTLTEAFQNASGAQAILVDWDGCLAHGEQLAPNAAALVRRWSDKIAIISNQSSIAAESIQRHLRREGVHMPLERILLAGNAALERVATAYKDASILLIASAGLREHARRAGVRVTPDPQSADIVLVLRDPNLRIADLGPAIEAVRRGAHLVASNPDLTHPSANGGVVVETGAVAHLISMCSGGAPVEFLGKPNGDLFLEALKRLRAAPADAVMIGDNPETDGLGAIRQGIRFLCVHH